MYQFSRGDLPELNSDLDIEYLGKFRKLGLINETALRNKLICERFDQLKAEGLTMRQCEYVLSDEFFLSPETIHHIKYVYSNRTTS